MHAQEGLDAHNNICSQKCSKKTNDLDKNVSTDDRGNYEGSFNNVDSVITIDNPATVEVQGRQGDVEECASSLYEQVFSKLDTEERAGRLVCFIEKAKYFYKHFVIPADFIFSLIYCLFMTIALIRFIARHGGVSAIYLFMPRYMNYAVVCIVSAGIALYVYSLFQYSTHMGINSKQALRSYKKRIEVYFYILVVHLLLYVMASIFLSTFICVHVFSAAFIMLKFFFLLLGVGDYWFAPYPQQPRVPFFNPFTTVRGILYFAAYYTHNIVLCIVSGLILCKVETIIGDDSFCLCYCI
ncbi:uncharacterized protein NEPG_02603 [Nematocida parisii ERTm1]|uniref:Uncharacterized protein n=1 Tax=Nematocida parisii (strain ERTm3) TaxID=935791 RepID=I3ED79_NEMP3|nr:uncharacterized protein NEPG_02603 [Nematocida parisii ERTm1]EIJ87176.1 hypothetical protein NEQG_02633 [Nematocida parisii ERTm3]EIJ92534.1 hypothetical protein NEPG_02603 [Nematocida parisii ERTm1]|eukprot:XP_013060430.1 hypothetical protein NEPG_02603 [Nematocida parisii ERTm1]